jgi:adenine-specific DNA-methyltransferase
MHIISKEKHIGQVFTPDYLVCEMLDYVGYLNKSDILDKHIIDNSCGNGAFLLQITERYIQTAINNNLSKERIIKGLETFIHGIDNDSVAIENCIINLNNLVSNYGFENVNWDIRNDNTLKVKDYDGKMDFVVGNPPYVRVHNLENNYDEVKQFKFAEGGMTDLYLVFFEIGFNMLNHTGKLCYITPSSWLNSLAAKNLRSYIMQYRNLLALIDLEHFQPFDKITTYTLISLFSKSIEIEKIDYYTFNSNTLKREFIDELSYEDILIDTNFYISKKENLCKLKNIKRKHKKYVSVKNGFATLADKSFIGDDVPETFITIPIIKGSTGKWSKCLFPYDKNGKPLEKELIFRNEVLKKHFEKEKENLLKGKPEYEGWYLFGRTQALSDVWKDKISINSLLRTKSDLKIKEVEAGKGVYSGLYVLGDVDIQVIKEILTTDEFVEYVKSIKKYKSGGYYTFNSKDVEQFINYKLNTLNNNEQSRIFDRTLQLFS